MKVNIYYGGRGMVDDPTIFVMGKIQEVLEELNVNVTRYNLYEMKIQLRHCHRQSRKQMQSYWQQQLNGLEWADICRVFWIPAGCMGIRTRLERSTCSRLLWQRHMANVRFRLLLQIRGKLSADG